MRFLRDMQNALYADLPLHRGPVGEPGGGSFVGTFEKKDKYIYTESPSRNVPYFGSVPYVKVYRYNPKHLYPKLNGYGDNGQRISKL